MATSDFTDERMTVNEVRSGPGCVVLTWGNEPRHDLVVGSRLFANEVRDRWNACADALKTAESPDDPMEPAEVTLERVADILSRAVRGEG